MSIHPPGKEKVSGFPRGAKSGELGYLPRLNDWAVSEQMWKKTEIGARVRIVAPYIPHKGKIGEVTRADGSHRRTRADEGEDVL